MSAYIVSKRTLNTITNAIRHRHEFRDDILNAMGIDESLLAFDGDKVFSLVHAELFRMNVKAVNYRYSQETSTDLPVDHGYNPTGGNAGDVQVVKCIDCFLYQCSEGDIVPNSLVFKLLERMGEKIAHKIVVDSREWDKAYWD